LGSLGEPPLLWAFLFAFIFWYSRAVPKRQWTAVATMPPLCLRDSVRVPVFKRPGRPVLPSPRLCASAREYSGRQDGAFAPDSWVPSARRPDFSIRGHLLAFAVRSRNGRGLPLLQQIFFVALRLRVRSGFLPGRDGAFAPQTELKRRAIRAAKDPTPTGWRVV
jgi:hypothetical protein